MTATLFGPGVGAGKLGADGRGPGLRRGSTAPGGVVHVFYRRRLTPAAIAQDCSGKATGTMKRPAGAGFESFRPALALILLTATLVGCDAAAPEGVPGPRQIGLHAPTTAALPAAVVPPMPTLAAARAASVQAVAGQVPDGPTIGNPSAAVAPAPAPPLDVTNRLVALERWAQDPRAPLEVVTTAMVDPDESVRERAQQLFEEALARPR